VPVAAQLQNPALAGPDRQVRYVIEKTVDRQLAMINKAAALGVTLGVGTDAGAAGVRHGYGYLQELDLYRQAGLTPAEIIKCATENGARILGLDWGRLEPGRPAALIAVEGDPLVDTGALGRVKYAFLPFKA
jgi:imidazolonepropionase-like amidohydrolase